jgi:4-hydroxybenzoate polyprenyltransferase
MFPSSRDMVLLCRPAQWVKNVFVLFPLLFSERIFQPAAVRAALVALAGFCLLASAVYIVNDLLDREADRRHPRKCLRPLASGRVSVFTALALASTLLAAVVAVSLLLPLSFLLFVGLYLANSLLYCFWIKHKVIADVMAIAIGFVLRILAGCAAIEVVPSSWIIVCGFSLALVLGFGKRRTEIQQLGSHTEHRPALENYDAAKLDTLLAISTAITLLAYMLYTVAPDTVQRHGTPHLVYSVPLVAYGLFRYLFKTQEGRGDGPTEILLGDRIFPLVGVLWVLTVALLLYWH